MRILAHADGNRILVEMTKTECAKIAGCDHEEQVTRGDLHPLRDSRFYVGRTFDVDAKWERLRAMDKIQDDLNLAAARLRGVAGLVEQLTPAVDIPALCDKAEGGEK